MVSFCVVAQLYFPLLSCPSRITLAPITLSQESTMTLRLILSEYFPSKSGNHCIRIGLESVGDFAKFAMIRFHHMVHELFLDIFSQRATLMKVHAEDLMLQCGDAFFGLSHVPVSLDTRADQVHNLTGLCFVAACMWEVEMTLVLKAELAVVMPLL